MTATVFFRLVNEDDRSTVLLDATRAVRAGRKHRCVKVVTASTFQMLPGAPFAYWVSDNLRRDLAKLPVLKNSSLQTVVTRGVYTTDDFRFVRLSWEIVPSSVGTSRAATHGNSRWVTFSKGGDFSPFYYDPHLAINWADDGCQLKAFLSNYRESKGWGPNWTAAINAYQHYFRAGLTWAARTVGGFSVRILPSGCIFGHKGPAILADDNHSLGFLLALFNSIPGRGLLELQMAAGSYEVGVVQRLPIASASQANSSRLHELAKSIHETKRSMDRVAEHSHVFSVPALIHAAGGAVRDCLEKRNAEINQAQQRVQAAQREIDEIIYSLYEISAEDRQTIEAELGTEIKGLPQLLRIDEATAALVSWAVGVALGRFDVRLATGARQIPELSDPFAPLPAYSPGMLPGGRVPTDYPIRVAEDGILVDDEGHDWDLVARVRDVLHLVFGDHADAIEREACEILGFASLRDYFTRLGAKGFWDDHVKRYSKSRRRAPIYWLLRSPGGRYSAWIYYHRLDRDVLHRLLGRRYLESKIQRVRQAIEDLRPDGRTKPGITKMEERRLADLDDFLVDLEEFGAKIQAIVTRINDRGETVGYDPDLDDGVVLNAAALHELIPWPKKRKYRGRSLSELAAYWEELAEGEYDWAHTAMRYWPTRVTNKCRADKSLALAHGLDDQFFPGLRAELRRQAETASDTGSQTDEPTEDDDVEEEEDE